MLEPSSLQMVAGSYDRTTSTSGSGIFNGFLTSLGTFSYFCDGRLWGSLSLWTTAASSGSKAGVRTSDDTTRRQRNPTLDAWFNIDNTLTDVLMFIGFHEPNGSSVAGTDPLLNLQGVGLCVNGGNFRIAHNDGSGSTFFQDLFNDGLGISSVAADLLPHRFQITVNDENTSILCTLDGLYSYNAQTDIPSNKQGLVVESYIETQAAATKTMELYRLSGVF